VLVSGLAGRARIRLQRGRWLYLLLLTRALGAAVAILLLAAHQVSDYDDELVLATLAWSALSLGAFFAFERLSQWWVAWLVDGVVALVLVYLSTDWRSPFYIFALTTLILPATELRFRRAVEWGCAWTLGYLAVALLTERLGDEIFDRAIRLEIVATHLMVPLVVMLSLAYASDLLRRLQGAHEESARLAIESERQRIAWELHDSAKQRVHAAHLVLTALDGRLDAHTREIVDHALVELRAATGDMDTSVAELREPLEGRAVAELLRERAAELGRASTAPIAVHGELPALPPLVATHAYRIAAEALTNAVRHGRAERIEVLLRPSPPAVEVRDDGVGIAAHGRPGSHGLLSMRNRAETIGARLEWRPGPDGRGTAVLLELPSPEDPRSTS
jgi:signal transduction histidine kinase